MDEDLAVGRNQPVPPAVFVAVGEPKIVVQIAERDEPVVDRLGGCGAVLSGFRGQIDVERPLKVARVVDRAILGRVRLPEVEEGVVGPVQKGSDQVGGILPDREYRRVEERNGDAGARRKGRSKWRKSMTR